MRARVKNYLEDIIFYLKLKFSGKMVQGEEIIFSEANKINGYLLKAKKKKKIRKTGNNIDKNYFFLTQLDQLAQLSRGKKAPQLSLASLAIF